MRVQSHIWVTGFIRRVSSAGGVAVLARRGEASAGAIYVRANFLNGTSQVFSPAPALLSPASGTRKWYCEHGNEPIDDAEADDFIRSQISYDGDLWVVEVECADGETYLGDELVELEI